MLTFYDKVIHKVYISNISNILSIRNFNGITYPKDHISFNAFLLPPPPPKKESLLKYEHKYVSNILQSVLVLCNGSENLWFKSNLKRKVFSYFTSNLN